MQENPLRADPPSEVPLPNAPLVRVIAQLRFPAILSVEQRDFVAPFQEEIRKDYPVLRTERTQGVLITPNGASPGDRQIVWRFSSADDGWRVSLAPDFLALETTAYSSRNDFLGRLDKVIGALTRHIEPSVVERFGIRYIDRISGEDMASVAEFVRHEVLGIITTPMAKLATRSLSQSLFSLPKESAQLMARWGCLPADSTADPSAIEPISDESWILDIDIFSAESTPLDVKKLQVSARKYAERAYTFFRWVVTDQFLRRYGGKV